MNNLMRMAIAAQGKIVDWWDDCSALLHMDGANNGTIFTDSGPQGHTVTANGSATTTALIRKYGTASLSLDRATSDYLSIPNHADFELGAGSFTLDCWIRLDDLGNQLIFSRTVDVDNRVFFGYIPAANGWYFQMIDGGSTTLAASWVDVPSTNTWIHVALVRDGNDFEVFVDGTSLGTATDTSPLPTLSTTLDIGRGRFTGGFEYSDCRIDEWRLLKGNALWTSNFTPPIKAYSKYE